MSKKSLVAHIEKLFKEKGKVDHKDVLSLMKITGLGFKQITSQVNILKKRMEEDKAAKGENFSNAEFFSQVVNEAKNNPHSVAVSDIGD